jgi:hypothetical protein
MSLLGRLKDIATAPIALPRKLAAGSVGRIVPGVPRAVSGINARLFPASMRRAAPSLGLLQRIQAARGVPAAVAQAQRAAGRVVDLDMTKRMPARKTLKRWW